MGKRKHTSVRKEVSMTASVFIIKPSETEKLLGTQHSFTSLLNGITTYEIMIVP